MKEPLYLDIAWRRSPAGWYIERRWSHEPGPVLERLANDARALGDVYAELPEAVDFRDAIEGYAERLLALVELEDALPAYGLIIRKHNGPVPLSARERRILQMWRKNSASWED